MASPKGKGRAARPAARKRKARAKKDVPAKVSKAELRLDAFVREYLVDLNGRQAAIRAGYSADSARQTASDLLARPDVQAKVQAVAAERLRVSEITAEAVLQRIHAIATADPRELTELHRGCCRYCWGEGHRKQYTPREFREAEAQWTKDAAAAKADGKEIGEFVHGGTGFNPKRDPHPHCPECFGDGEERVVFKDTRDLSPAARMLFAGVKQTQHGMEMKFHSQTDALGQLAKFLGLFKEKVEVTGKDGGPVQHALLEVLDDIEGSDTGIGPATSRRE